MQWRQFTEIREEQIKMCFSDVEGEEWVIFSLKV